MAFKVKLKLILKHFKASAIFVHFLISTNNRFKIAEKALIRKEKKRFFKAF